MAEPQIAYVQGGPVSSTTLHVCALRFLSRNCWEFIGNFIRLEQCGMSWSDSEKIVNLCRWIFAFRWFRQVESGFRHLGWCMIRNPGDLMHWPPKGLDFWCLTTVILRGERVPIPFYCRKKSKDTTWKKAPKKLYWSFIIRRTIISKVSFQVALSHGFLV